MRQYQLKNEYIHICVYKQQTSMSSTGEISTADLIANADVSIAAFNESIAKYEAMSSMSRKEISLAAYDLYRQCDPSGYITIDMRADHREEIMTWSATKNHQNILDIYNEALLDVKFPNDMCVMVYKGETCWPGVIIPTASHDTYESIAEMIFKAINVTYEAIQKVATDKSITPIRYTATVHLVSNKLIIDEIEIIDNSIIHIIQYIPGRTNYITKKSGYDDILDMVERTLEYYMKSLYVKTKSKPELLPESIKNLPIYTEAHRQTELRGLHMCARDARNKLVAKLIKRGEEIPARYKMETEIAIQRGK